MVLLLLCAALGDDANPIVFSQDFSGAASAAAPGDVVEEEDRSCLRISNSGPEKSATVHIPLDAQRITGQLVTARATLKASDVSEPPNSWNGIKVMLVLQKDGDTVYPQMPLPAGTFEWRDAVESIRLPTGIDKAHLVLGLEKVSGTVWFDEVELRLGRPSAQSHRTETRFRGHGLPRLRGAMHGPQFHEPNVHDLGITWNANHMRWQLKWTPMKKAEEWAKNLEEYDNWLDGALDQFDQALPACEKYGLVVLLDLHTPPGGRAEHGVCRNLHDVIELFEEYGWDWTYHAFREWDGWSVEHGPEPEDKERAETPTKRQELLLEWFAKNEKPA